MSSVNRVILVGNLGGKPELRESKGGKPYTCLRLATHRYRGPEQEKATEWHSVFAFGQDAERCVEWLNKGAMLYIEGSLSYWQLNKDGEKRDYPYRNAINAERIQFLTFGKAHEEAIDGDNLDIPTTPRNHNAVAHL